MKRCCKCNELKDESEFYKDKSRSDGLTSRCRTCKYIKSDSNWEMEKKLRKLAIECGKNICSACGKLKPLEDFYKDEYRCKECCIKRSATHGRLDKTGWTDAEYVLAFIEQEGKCAICKKEQEEKSLAADHCHRTGKKRGLLCDSCNLLLGKAGDDPEVLRNAALYLEGRLT